jgi:hypothetical protein
MRLVRAVLSQERTLAAGSRKADVRATSRDWREVATVIGIARTIESSLPTLSQKPFCFMVLLDRSEHLRTVANKDLAETQGFEPWVPCSSTTP